MSQLLLPCGTAQSAHRQRGAVLFFTLIALVVMALATLAMIRSVDTTTLISGNLAFRQAATTSGDGGVEAAIAAMTTIQAAATQNVYMDATHPFNVTSAATGYYSNADPALSLTADTTWVDGASSAAVTDSSGNTYRYIIQRMCRTANQVLSKPNCLFSGTADSTGEKTVLLTSDVCDPAVSPGCPTAGQAPQYRVTVRVTGPKNTVSYIQALVF